MKYQIIITGPDGGVFDKIAVINGASLALAPGENVILVDENEQAAIFTVVASGSDSIVTFENGEWVKLMNYSFSSKPPPLIETAAVVHVAESAADLAESGEKKIPTPIFPEEKPEIESGAVAEPMSAAQVAPINIAFGAAASIPVSGDAGQVENLVGSLSTDNDFTLIRGSDVSHTNFVNRPSAQLPNSANPAPTNQQGIDDEPTLLVRETTQTRFFSRSAPPAGPQNLAPVAKDDEIETTQGETAIISILENDFDPEGDEITPVFIAGQPLVVGTPVVLDSGAVVVFNDDGTIKYDPGTNFTFVGIGETAIDTFSYTIEDSHGAQDSATVSVKINGLNDAPDAVDDPADVNEDGPSAIPVLDNDGDPDGDPLTVTEVSNPPSGAIVTINPDGTVTYDPNGLFETLAVGETATDTFTYTVDDGHGSTDTATVTVTIHGQNDPSVVEDDAATLDEDDSTNIPLLDNDSDIDGDDLCVGYINGQSISEGDTIPLPSGATLTLLPDGSVDYDTSGAYNTLSLGETEVDSFTYSLCADHDGFTQTATVTVTVEGQNDAPLAANDAASTLEGTAVGIDVLANDSDVDASDVLSVDTVGAPAQGTTTINADGTITFDPNGEFESLAVGETATVNFDYTITDGNGGSDGATVTVTINGENDGPDALDDADDVASDEDVDIDVLANDTDIDTSDVLTISNITQPATGAVVTQNADGTLNYDPGLIYDDLGVGETEIDTFSYTIDDGNGGTDTATVTVTIHGSNNAPEANDDFASTDEDGPVTIDILANDTDPNAGDTLTVSGITSQTGDGMATLNADGLVTFDPNGEFESLAVGETAITELTYEINDGHGKTDTATVTITINGVNDGPAAVADDSASTTESAAVTIDVLANDSDIDASDVLTVASVTQPTTSGAVVTINADNTVDYDPNGNFESLAVGETATDTFSYVVDDGNGGTDMANVTVTIHGENDGPDAVADDSASTTESAAVTIDVLANDSDIDASDVLTVASVTQPTTSGAVVTINADNTLDYNPNGNFEDLAVGETATDTFSYVVDDGNGGTDMANVTVTIHGENDGPAAVADDSASTTESAAVTIDVLANDSDIDVSDVLTVASVTQPTTSGAVVTINADNTLDYNPNGNFEDLAVGETATDTFSYVVDDGNGGTDMANVTVTIHGENDGPDALDDAATTDEDSATTIDVLANDTDIDTSDALVISEIIQPTSGAVATLNVDGTVDYDPSGSFESLAVGETAIDTFSYTIDDGNGGTDTANVTVIINGVNDGPNAVADDSASTTESAAVTIDVLANDSDIDASDVLTVASVTQPTTSGAVVTINADNTVDYDPNGNFEDLAVGETATDTFSYVVDDGNGGTDTANVTVTIHGENDGPDAVADDSASTTESAAVTIDVLANDSDIDASDVLTVASVTTPASGAVVTINADNTLNYDPNGNFENLAVGETATDTFSYVVDDGNGGTDTANVTVTIFGENDTPDAADDVASTNEGDSINIAVLANDTDVDISDDLSVRSVVQPTSGAIVTINADDTVRYNPNGVFESLAAGESTTDTFSYVMDDGNGGTATANVTVTIFGENDAPDAIDDTASVTEDASVNIPVLANDTDIDTSDTLSVSHFNGTAATTGVLVTLPSGAQISLAADGTVDYVTNGAFESLAVGDSATDTFSYTMDDGNGGTDTATVTVTIDGVNDVPEPTDDIARTDEDTPTNIDVLANDTDIDTGDGLSVTEINGTTITTGTPFILASGASVTLAADGTLDFSPVGAYDYLASGETAIETFHYTVDDGNGGTAIASVDVTIDGVNDAPIAVNDERVVFEDGPSVAFDVTPDDPAQDRDAEGPVSVVAINGTDITDGQIVTLASGALLTVGEDGTLDYNPNDAFHALLDEGESFVETITYAIEDEHGERDTATVEVMIIGQNDPPVLLDDCSMANTPGEAVTLNVLANDTDIDGTIDPTSLDITTVDLDPTTPGRQTEIVVDGQGVWTADDAGNITFTPDPTLTSDPDPIHYAVADNHGVFGEPAEISLSFFTSDIWFANDLSGSVSATEYDQGIGLIADVGAAIDFGVGEMGNQMGMISWGGPTQQSIDVPLTSDQDDFIAAVNADDRSFTGPVITDIAAAINFSIDAILDPSSGSRQPDGVAQVLTVMTDVHPDQLFNRPPYDNPFYPQDVLANIELAADRAAANGITLVFLAIEDADDPEVLAALDARSDFAFGAGDYADLGPDIVIDVVEQLRVASVPEEHRGCIAAAPIAVDFNGDNIIEYEPMEGGFLFDLDGDGTREQIAWVGNDDAVLIYDRDQDGQISHRSEFILSDWTREVDTDLEAIATFFDTNKDGVFDADDAKFTTFAIWQDADGDSEVDVGEWTTLLDAGIIGFNVTGDGEYTVHAEGHVEVFGNSEFIMENGDTMLASDASFRFRDIPETAEILTTETANEPISTSTDTGQPIIIEAIELVGIDHDQISIETGVLPEDDAATAAVAVAQAA